MKNNDLISPNEDFTSFSKQTLRQSILNSLILESLMMMLPELRPSWSLSTFIFGNSLYEINKENLRFLCGGLRKY